MIEETSESTPPTATKAAKAKRAPRKPRKALPPKVVPMRLAQADTDKARAAGRAWDRHVTFALSDYFVHAVFGVGYVTERTPEFITCLFEGGETRRLIHAR